MRRILCIRLPDWPSQRHAVAPPVLDDREALELLAERCRRFSPLVGLEPTGNDSLLLDVTGLARLFGGEPSLAEAIVRDLAKLRLRATVAIADTIGAAWAMARYCEEDCKLKIENCKLQIGSSSSFPRSAWERTGCDAPRSPNRRGASGNAGSHAERGNQDNAASICNFQFAICNLQSSLLVILPPRVPSAFFDPLPIEGLRLPAEVVRLLHALGITSVGQLKALPREEFLARFGPVLLRRLDQLLGRLDERVLETAVPPKFAAGWSTEYPTTQQETIEAALEHLAGRVAAALSRCGWGALRLECRLSLEMRDRPAASATGRQECPPHQSDPGRQECPPRPGLFLSVGLFQPTAAARRLFELLRLQLEGLRIASPVTAIAMAATLTAPLDPPRQAGLFDFDGQGDCPDFRASENGTVPFGHRRSRELAALAERLSSRLGRRAVVRVRLRPEAQPELSWQEEPLVGGRRWRSTAKRLPAELPPCPLRLLPRPRLLWTPPVCVSPGTSPLEPPRQFRLAGREHQIARHWGPERIETGWWRGQPAGRDYFRVETAAGSRYWLFRRLRDGKWFLHGMFE